VLIHHYHGLTEAKQKAQVSVGDEIAAIQTKMQEDAAKEAKKAGKLPAVAEEEE
jgi:hypothetical protein